MKKALLLFMLIPFFGMAQLSDTTCIQSRWIALKPTQVNALIFGSDTTLSEDLDLIHVIRVLVEKEELQIYNQKNRVKSNHEWYEIEFQNDIHDYINYMSDGDAPSKWAPFFTLYGVQSDMPLTDEYGEPLTRLTAEGFEEYIYPPRDVYYYPTKEVDEIRIKENRVFNEKTKKFEFQPVGLSFYFRGSDYYRGHEAFWVDLVELQKALKNNTNFPWYKSIYEKNYQGFQYMQVSCYDSEIKY
jgi:hypothetical protein